jgi:hypothetical protein
MSSVQISCMFLLLANLAMGQQEPPNFRSSPRHAAEPLPAASADHLLHLPGLVADRQARRVEIRVESTGIAGGETCEYLVVGPGSSHGYESLFWAQAKPSDVGKALAFIGLPAGQAFAPGTLRFWSKGERVIAQIVETDAAPIRLEALILDRKIGAPLAETGFIVTGSHANFADRHDARAIIPAYNETAAICDLPCRARRAEVYQRYVANPDLRWPAHELATLVLSPEATSHVQDLRLDIGPDCDFDALLSRCYTHIAAGRIPYASVHFDTRLALAQTHEIARMLARIDVDHALHIEPPTAGQLYYRAFLPDPAWRDPAARISQPWELHLNADSATLLKRDGKTTPQPIANSAVLKERLLADSASTGVLLVFAPADMAYGTLLEFLAPIQASHPRIHVFSGDPP